MKFGLLRLVTSTGELRQRAAAATAAILEIIWPATLPPGDRALLIGSDGQLKYGQVGTNAHEMTFTNANLTAGVLTVTHNLGVKVVCWSLADDEDDAVLPDNIGFTDTNNLTVDLSSFGAITGTWTFRAIG
jgi:hypothetical protein